MDGWMDGRMQGEGSGRVDEGEGMAGGREGYRAKPRLYVKNIIQISVLCMLLC